MWWITGPGILMFVLGSSDPGWCLTSKVLIVSGGDESIRAIVGGVLTGVVNGLEKKGWKAKSEFFTEEGLQSLGSLDTGTDLVNVNPLYETDLISLSKGGWEVRNIKVLLRRQDVRGNPYQYLVFSFDKDLKINDVRFALDEQQYAGVIQSGAELEDYRCRQQILQFLEIFRTAYNRKEIDYLKNVYSDDALIIVGRVIEAKPDAPKLMERSRLNRDRIEFIRQSKQEYITRLQKVFAVNEFIKVGFSEVEVRRHPKFDKIYGVILKQDWRSSSYSDSGWLFLMIDFRDQAAPLIHVRSWQPVKFADGSVVSLGDFDIID
jgi:hypothetical protein